MGRRCRGEFYSILDLKENLEKEKARPAFYVDLNLDQVIHRISRDWGEDVSPFYYYLPADRECEDYRREIYADIRQEELFRILCRFSEKMKARREVFFKKKQADQELQKRAWHVQEIGYYCEAFLELSGELEKIPLRSRGMEEFREFLYRCLSGADFEKMREQVRRLQEQLYSLRLILVYEGDRITVSLGEVEGEYETFLERCFPGEDRRMKSPFEASGALGELEFEIVKVCEKLKPDLFRELKSFYKTYGEYACEELTRFASEIGFYLSFCGFQRRMQERGFAFAQPVILEETQGMSGMSARGLYDLALACLSLEEGRKVVSNDMICREGERFFVLTGPNQGGKTTFARSLGQLVYFAKMGLDVPAVSAQLYHFTDILTHFTVEESLESGRGKLMEELVRLGPMMTAARGDRTDGGHARAFVVINELFTTAADYDGTIMGKRVLEHFLAQGCMGIYVTHLRELGRFHPQIVSLRALLGPGGEHTFLIGRGEAADSADSGQLVEKHGLSYAGLKERLGRRCRPQDLGGEAQGGKGA